MSLWFGRHRASAVDEQLVSNVGKIYDSLPCFMTIVGHVGCCDDLLPSCCS